jgi:hypothetical protein
MLSVIFVGGIIFSVIILDVIIGGVIILGVIMLSAVILGVFMLRKQQGLIVSIRIYGIYNHSAIAKVNYVSD